MEETTVAWERLPAESKEAYRAFDHYRTTPLGRRSVLNTYRYVSGRESAKRASGRFVTWSRLHKWTERVRAYEDSLARRLLQEREDAEIKALEDHRDRCSRLAVAATESAIRCLTIANRTLQQWSTDPTFTFDAKNLGPILRAATAAAQVGAEAEGRSLGVDELLRAIKGEEE